MTQCPSCSVPLRLVIESGVDIDVCDECLGVWLDPGELTSLADDLAFSPRQFDACATSELNCPRCTTRHFAVVETEWGRFTRCVDCGGLFVGGETLDALAKSEASVDDQVPKVLPTKESAIMTTELLQGVAELLRMFGSR